MEIIKLKTVPVGTESFENFFLENCSGDRMDWDNYFLCLAAIISLRSTCLRRKYGSLIVKNNKIVSSGYNGAPCGMPHCTETGECYREAHNIPHGQQYEKCISGNSIIKLLNGTYKTIRELAISGKDFWTYSIDTATGEIVPALATNPRFTGIRSDMLKITFDNGATVTCTSDHKFLMSDCTYKEAKDLSIYDSVMPMYYSFYHNGVYETIYNSRNMRKEGRWKRPNEMRNTGCIPTHKLVYEFFSGKSLPDQEDDVVLHHKNGDKHDNRFENLELLPRRRHSYLHMTENEIRRMLISKYALRGVEAQRRMLEEDPDFLAKKRAVGSANMTKNWNNEIWRKNMEKIQVENGRRTVKILNSPENRHLQVKGRVLKGLSLLISMMSQNNDTSVLNTSTYETVRRRYIIKGKGSLNPPTLKTVIKCFGDLESALESSKTYNHKVIKIEKIFEAYDVYDVTVPKYHNFPIDLGDNSCVFVHNCAAVHSECNAIISGNPSDMAGADIYLIGFDVAKKSFIKAIPCEICLPMLINAKIRKVITYDPVKNKVVSTFVDKRAEQAEKDLFSRKLFFH